MAFLGELGQGEEQAGVEAGRGVVGETEVDRDLVGGLETDAVDFAGHPVGFGQEDLLGLRTVFADQFHALRGRDAVGLQEDEDLAQRALVVPGFLDRGSAGGADAWDFAQAGRLLADHAQGVGTEAGDDLVGVSFPDTGDEAAAEVFADTVDAGGQFRAPGGDLELRAVLRVVDPLAVEGKCLAALDTGERAHNGDEGRVGHGFGGAGEGGTDETLASFATDGGRRTGGRNSGEFRYVGCGGRCGLGGIGAQLGDGVAVLLVEENDALKHTAQVGGRVRRAGHKKRDAASAARSPERESGSAVDGRRWRALEKPLMGLAGAGIRAGSAMGNPTAGRPERARSEWSSVHRGGAYPTPVP